MLHHQRPREPSSPLWTLPPPMKNEATSFIMYEKLQSRSSLSDFYPSPPELHRSSSPSSGSWASDMSTNPSTPRIDDKEIPRAANERRPTFTETLFEPDFEPSITPTLLNIDMRERIQRQRHEESCAPQLSDDESDHGMHYAQQYPKATSCDYDERQPIYQQYSVAEDNTFALSMRYSQVPESEDDRVYRSRTYEYPMSPEGKDYHYTHTYSHSAPPHENPIPRDADLHALQCVTAISPASHGFPEDSRISEDESYTQQSISLGMIPRVVSGNCESGAPRNNPTGSTRRRATKRSQAELPLVVSSNDKPHVCDKCSRRFRRPEHLRRHGLAHTGEKPYQCTVRGCKRRFSRTDNLRAHRRTHTTPGGRNTYVPELGPP